MDAAIQEGTLVVEEDSSAEEGGLKKMNAFDLINMCGGMALQRMFQTHAPPLETFAHNNHPTRPHTQFTSHLTASEITHRLKDELLTLQCQVADEHHAHKVKATLQTPKGQVGIIIQIYELAENLHFIEARRGKGDIFEYHKFYGQLSERLSTLLSPAAPDALSLAEEEPTKEKEA